MNRKMLLAVLFSSFAIAACKPQAPAEPATPAEPVAEVPADVAPPATESTPANSPADMPFDVKGLAGTFTGTLPCADCPGIDTRLVLAADGSYKVQETYRSKPGNDFKGEGTWTVEEDGKRIRLDPNSKDQDDRLFEVKSKDEIESLDAQGQPIATAAPRSLKRDDMMGGMGM